MLQESSLLWWLSRQRYRLASIRDREDALNRRAAVEARLLDAASGKRPLPDRKECQELAFKLGVPSWARRSNS